MLRPSDPRCPAPARSRPRRARRDARRPPRLSGKRSRRTESRTRSVCPRRRRLRAKFWAHRSARRFRPPRVHRPRRPSPPMPPMPHGALVSGARRQPALARLEETLSAPQPRGVRPPLEPTPSVMRRRPLPRRRLRTKLHGPRRSEEAGARHRQRRRSRRRSDRCARKRAPPTTRIRLLSMSSALSLRQGGWQRRATEPCRPPPASRRRSPAPTRSRRGSLRRAQPRCPPPSRPTPRAPRGAESRLQQQRRGRSSRR